MKKEVINFDNTKVGEVELNDSIFGQPIRVDIIHRVVEWQRAKKRSGNHKTKGVSEISGTTKKPYKQKGTGNARQGSLRSPQFRGGAVIFGPVVRSHEYSLPKKVRKLGLKSALSAKFTTDNLIIIDDIHLNNAKTAELKKKLDALNIESALIIDGDEVDNNFKLAAANLKYIDVLPTIGLNVLDIMKHDKLIITKGALTKIEERLQ